MPRRYKNLQWELTKAQSKDAKWNEEKDEEGNVFYRNSVSGETSWENPEKEKPESKKLVKLKKENGDLKKKLKKLQTESRKDAVRKNKMMTDVNELKGEIKGRKKDFEELTEAKRASEESLQSRIRDLEDLRDHYKER